MEWSLGDEVGEKGLVYPEMLFNEVSIELGMEYLLRK
jgi:hypothetical protein